MSETILNREAILAAEDIETRLVEVPEWGGSVYVRAMSGRERDELESSIVKQRGKQKQMDLRDVRAKVAAICIRDAEGERMFNMKDVQALSDKSAGALQRVFEVAQEMSGLTDEAAEELLGNS